MNKQQLIENIKKEYIEEKNKKSDNIKNMWSQYQKMAKELSEGIYSEDNHFIYELIQNAEDTICEEEKHILEFYIDNKGLLTVNNEIGFKENEIKAICAFGESTKSKDKNSGYIGEKGIGFKSVFKITDYPAINSNGYKFYFRRYDENDNTEYIIPHWIDDNKIKNYPTKFQEDKNTKIYLPFRQDKNREKLQTDIKDIEPIILLFLKKLDAIKIFNDNKEIINTEKKKHKNEHITTISILSNKNKQRYFIFKKEIEVNQNLDEVKNKDGRRQNVKNREIILAFPDKKNTEKEDRIFAFLPTQLHSGLRFIIQADFILQSGRENIAIDNEWNRWQLQEIEHFIVDKIINDLKKHSKLKYDYLNYFIKDNNSNNDLIEYFYENIISNIEQKNIILTDKETWEKPQNIILLEDNLKLDTKYIKLLFGENYEQVHPKFQLNNFFINKFNIRKVCKKEIIKVICDYFDKYNLNDYDESVVFELTKFLAKNLSIDSRALSYEKELFDEIKKYLPIIPKYKSNKKFYLYDRIFISSEYQPDIIIENFVTKNEFNFNEYNFLGDEYREKDNKQLENFIRKIIEEQKEHKNKKTIEFFIKYPDVLHKYLKQNIERHYQKIFDFFMANQENNKDKISKILFVLAQDGKFYNSNTTIYFFNDSKDDLKVLDETLFRLVDKESKYKDFLKDIFKIKEADIINIIISEYLPKIRAIQHKRDIENDKKLLNYTKIIIENFDKFEKEDQEKIKQSMFFISSNQQNKYLKASQIYLTQSISEIVFNDDSIEKYINDKSFFDFLDDSYDQILENIEEKKTKQFFNYFKFEKNIKEKDIKNFVKLIKDDLKLNENIEALTLISNSLDEEDKKKIDDIKEFKVYSNKDNLVEIKNLFFEKIDDIDLEYLHQDYKKDRLNNLKQYFQFPYNIAPFIEYLKQDINFDEAIKVYKYLDNKSKFNPNIRRNKSHTITQDKIKIEFKKNKLIFDDKNNRYSSNDITWREEKSSSKLFALSTIYPAELEDFFVNKVKVSQTKNIKQIIKKLTNIKERNNDYFNLLIDLGDLIVDNSEIDKYYDSFGNNKPPIKNKYDDMKKFIVEKERIFILDSGKKNKDNNFYFNDLEIDVTDDLKTFMFSIHKSNYNKNHFDKLIDTLSIKRLSKNNISKEAKNYLNEFSITQYRELLHYAYDYLFSKDIENYKNLENKEDKLKEINLVNSIFKYSIIEANIIINNKKLPLKNKNELYYFEDNILKIINNKNLIFKIISNKIGFDDKILKDFYNEVIKGNKDKNVYYKDEGIKEKQNFPLEISEKIIQSKSYEEKSNTNKEDYKDIDCYEENDCNDEDENNILKDKSAEEEREERRKEQEGKSGAEQVKGYNRNIQNDNIETEPQNLIDKNKYSEQYVKNKQETRNKIAQNSKKLSPKTKQKITDNKFSRIGEEETKDFFRRKDQYLGQCQICGFTFKTIQGINYCERFSWGDYKKIKVKTDYVDAGNSLCLCAKCHSILKNGDFEATFLTDEVFEYLTELKDDYDFDTFIEDIDSDKLLNPPDCFKEHIDFEDMYFVDIRLNNKDERIYFTEEHLVMFFDFLKNG